MSRDPFDEMKRQNPVPRDELPGAPMAMADRILAGRVRHTWPGWAMAAAAAVSVAVVGFGLFWFLGQPGSHAVADGDTTTTTTGAVTTSGATVTTIVMRPVDGVVYFFLDHVGEGWSDGPFLVPVHVTLERGDYPTEAERILDEVFSAMGQLLAGVGEGGSSVPALSSAVPVGTSISDVGVEEATGIVSVNLSGEFGSGGGTLSMMGRLGQVVYTLTAIDGVNGVRFYVDGQPTTVFGGEGVTIPDPATRADFEGLLPAIMIESPSYGDIAPATPLIARGTANVFEATVSVALTDGEGRIIWEGFTTATCGTGCRGDWEVSIPYEVDEYQLGSLIVWESSAQDGSQTNVREHPVWLPATTIDDGPTTTVTVPADCSGTLAAQNLVDQAGLPAAVAEKRAAIWDAAVECDWDQLERLLGPGFSYTFGIDTDPIASWQEREAAGDRPMYYLAELLNRPFAILTPDGGPTYYTWPSAFATEWSAVPEADRRALLPLYDEADLDTFAEFGSYYGYRIGIVEPGTWVYFIAGD